MLANRRLTYVKHFKKLANAMCKTLLESIKNVSIELKYVPSIHVP